MRTPAPGYDTSKKESELRGEIVAALKLLGAAKVTFTSGKFAGDPPRYGYVIQFTLDGEDARMQVAALPLRGETATKKEKALRQALYIVEKWLKSAITSRVFSPGYHPLMQFLLVEGGRETIGEMLVRYRGISMENPALLMPPPKG